jgi:hypothetical protein
MPAWHPSEPVPAHALPTPGDQADAGAIVKAWTKRFKMDKKPKYMFGISSGAAFAIKFPGTMYIDGVVSGGRAHATLGRWQAGRPCATTHEQLAAANGWVTCMSMITGNCNGELT